MKIKRLEISGFKSFVEKASFDFPEGVTAVVGPNGCGKSNVVDAIRWVMGEQSAKNLRGRAMEDVIFGGSESRKPLGMAEVSLVFSTQDGKVPAKYLNYSEIQVTRRLYRDGESDYLLNRTPCRLMDITELFMDTGVGARAYSIIEQGRIGMILMAKPEERRFLIEEAAGVTKYKSRKQVALKKMEATKQNLLRIGDIVGEVRRQLNTLHRQAKKAERFRAVREELRGIELFFATRRHIEIAGQKAAISREMAVLEQKGAELSAAIELKCAGIEALRLDLVEEEERLTAAQEEIFKGRADLQGAENRLEFQKKEIANLETQGARLGSELALLQKQIAEAEAEQASLELKSRGYLVDSLGEEEVITVKERQLEELSAAERVAALTLEDSRKRLFGLMGEISQAANQQSAAAKRLELLAERIQRSGAEEQSLKTVLMQSEERVAALQLKVIEDRSSFHDLTAAIEALSGEQDTLRASLAGIEAQLQERRDELSSVTSRLHSLQELEAQFAGYGQGVRTLMLADSFKGRFSGLLADAVEADEEVETALEAVLGSRLQDLLSPAADDVIAAVEHLKTVNGGRCGFLLPAKVAQRAAAEIQDAEPLLARVKLQGIDGAILETLLDKVMLTSDLPAAIRLSQAHPDYRFVTLHGDLAYGGAVVIGGSREPTQSGLIYKKREIRGLAVRKKHFEEQVAELSLARAAHSAQIGEKDKELQSRKQTQRLCEINLVTAEKDLQSALAETARLQERLSLKGLEDEQLFEERELLSQEMIAAGVRKESSEELKTGLEAEVSLIQLNLAEKRRDIDAVRSEVTAMKVRAAALKERQEATSAALKRVSQLQTELAARAERQSQELQQGGATLERLKGEAAGTEEKLRQFMHNHAEREELLLAVKSSYEVSLQRLKDEEQLLKELRSEDDRQRKMIAETSLKLSTLLMELENLETQLKERFRLGIDEIAVTETDAGLDDEQLASRQIELQKQVDEFGEVNLTAIEEYQELEQRHTFLAEQKADLEESLQSLQQAIQRINRTTRKRFAETFAQVNEKFREVFPRLFCGGKAELRLTNEDDLLETGLDIIVQPPGKKLQNVSLLSGGEKALTAVALIFSIFLIKPSPFCLLDEVDAPLDDANIGRFNDMIRQMSAFSQFILITHSKTTMAVANTLYGVTMEEPGVSKLVSVKLQ